ncbi:MBL fold metallo-hydrolase [Lentzea sp. NPDC060358]|uniref:MBL fold metallo-hydrolase n=1 Tax=Lentzea sp. NPDC060358 TaxID=3347103 RepID=UPI003653308F
MRGSLHFVGNATTVLRLGPFTLLTDPNFLHKGQWTHIGQGIVSRRLTDPAVEIADLPELDAVLLSHFHGDHFDRVASRQLPHDLPVLTTPHAAKRLSRRGFREATPLRTWQTTTMSSGAAKLTITSLPGRHALGPLGRLLPPVMGTMLEYREAAGVLPFRIYLSGDTLVHPELRAIRERFDGIDLAVMHLGGTKVLGVLLTMDGEQGADLMELLDPRVTVPVHYEEYGVMKSPLSDFTAEVSRRRTGLDVQVVERGDSFAFPNRD